MSIRNYPPMPINGLLFIILIGCCGTMSSPVSPTVKTAPMLGVTATSAPDGSRPSRSIRSATYSSNMAAMGLHHKYQPQQFYHQQQSGTAASAAAAGGITTDLASLNLVTTLQNGREDICKICKCSQGKNAFLTVYCSFIEHPHLSPDFDAKYRVPQNATSMSIHLGMHTQFLLHSGFFMDNTINSLTIEGTYSEKSQVELKSGAFSGNRGPFPEITLNNVFTVLVRSKAVTGNAKFTVKKANSLVLFENAFKNAEINGHFVAIQDLRIEEKAFNSAQAKLRIESSHIDNIYRFEASLREIRFVNTSINTINSGTFDVNNINSIVFEGCIIGAIKSKAITEKLFSKHVAITGAIIGSIESDAIFGSGISELLLMKNSIDRIFENAIHVTAINVTIAQNNITHLGNNWLRVEEWSKIIVERNKFGEFGRMAVEPTKSQGICRFDGNSVTKPLPGSLNNMHCVLREISVALPCRCNREWLNEFSDHDIHSETYCLIDEKLGQCFNASTFNSLKYEKEVCDPFKVVLDCVANRNLQRVKGRFFTSEELAEHNQNTWKWPFICVAIAGLILLVVAVVLVAYCCRRPKRGPPSVGGGANDHCHDFSADERNVIEDTLKVVHKKYPAIERKINKLTQKLLAADLPKDKCVNVIVEIEKLLVNVDHGPDGDFAAFKRILFDHVQPEMPSAPPQNTLYSQADLDTNDDGFYTSNTIIGLPTGGYDNCAPRELPYVDEDAIGPRDQQLHHASQQPQEHIYAEPNCVQQPLLPNEYSSPADRNTDNMYEYTEPINERGFITSQTTTATTAMPTASTAAASTKPAVPAYAVTPMQHHLPQNKHSQPQMPPLTQTTAQRLPQYAMPWRQQPSNATQPQPNTNRNLPDVLHQSSPTTSHHNQHMPPATATPPGRQSPLSKVQKIAQDLQNQPKFHLNQFSAPGHSRHLHLVAMPPVPVYTAPDLTRKRSRADEYELDMRGAMALPPDSGSDHSGGSDETVKIDDVIEYADA